MSAGQIFTNPHYREYLRLLLQLQDLMAQGKGDDEEADAVRDDMDTPWRFVSSEEDHRLGGLSADLYMLTGEEIFEKVDAEDRRRERLGPDLEAAWQARDWDRVLALLRRGPDFLAVDQLAYLRGRCWLALGHPEVATRFFEYALHLRPENVQYRLAALEPLLALGQADLLRERLQTGAAQAETSVRQWFASVQPPAAVA